MEALILAVAHKKLVVLSNSTETCVAKTQCEQVAIYQRCPGLVFHASNWPGADWAGLQHAGVLFTAYNTTWLCLCLAMDFSHSIGTSGFNPHLLTAVTNQCHTRSHKYLLWMTLQISISQGGSWWVMYSQRLLHWHLHWDLHFLTCMTTSLNVQDGVSVHLLTNHIKDLVGTSSCIAIMVNDFMQVLQNKTTHNITSAWTISLKPVSIAFPIYSHSAEGYASSPLNGTSTYIIFSSQWGKVT